MRPWEWGVTIAGTIFVAGCRTATRVTEVPRVDLELSQGNRGYLIGTPPEAASLKTTRQMIETTMEVPSFYRPRRTGQPVGIEGLAPPEMEMGPEGETSTSQAPVRYDTYVVQKGDSLWSIAAKPQVYGKATQWRRIFDANRDVLKSPDRVRPGITLKIPRDGGTSATTYDDEGATYTK